MDFGTNSLWGSFSAGQAGEQTPPSKPPAKAPTTGVVMTPVASPAAAGASTPSTSKTPISTSVAITPAAARKPATAATPATPAGVNKSEVLDESVVSPSGGANMDHIEKWDINEYLGERGDGCISGAGCKCPECGMDFAFAGLLQVHRSKMHNVTPIPSCKQCNMVFRRIMGLINHWRTGVPHVKDRGGIKLLGCDICDSFNIINGFKDKDDIAEHTRAVHGQNVLIDSTNFDKPLCPLCQRGFTYRKGVIEHIQILHGEHLVVDLIGATQTEVQKRLIDELQYKCHYCPKTFRVKKSLLQHLEKFHQDTSGYTQPRPGSPLSTFKAHSVKGEEYNEWILQPVQPSVDFTGAEGDTPAAAGGGKAAQGDTTPAAAAAVDNAAAAAGHSSSGEGKAPHGSQSGGPQLSSDGRGGGVGGGAGGGGLPGRGLGGGDGDGAGSDADADGAGHRAGRGWASARGGGGGGVDGGGGRKLKVKTKSNKRLLRQKQKKMKRMLLMKKKKMLMMKKKKREREEKDQKTTLTEAVSEYKTHLAKVRPAPVPKAAVAATPTPPPGAFINPAVSARRASTASSTPSSGNMDELQQIKDFINSSEGGSKTCEKAAADEPTTVVTVDSVKTLAKTVLVEPATSDTSDETGKKAKKKKGGSSKGGAKRSLRSNAPESPSKRKQQLEEEEVEECEECHRHFRGYFSLMRHHAFTHQREKTSALLKLNFTPSLAVASS